MTRDEFLALCDHVSPLVIYLPDGRMGLCNHWTDTEVLVDAYRGSAVQQLRIPFAAITDVGLALRSSTMGEVNE
jgi:hypothetical protein